MHRRTRKWLFGCAGTLLASVALLLVLFYWPYLTQPDNPDLRAQLAARSKIEWLALADFQRIPASLLVFQFHQEYPIQLKTYDFGLATITPDGGHFFALFPGPDTLTIPPEALLTGLDGSVIRRIPRQRLNGANYRVAVSPNVERLACWLSGGVAVLNLVSPNLDEIPIADERLRAADTISWSPRNSELAFEFRGGIYVHDFSAGSSRHLTGGHWPSWSLDGRWIAYRSLDGEAMIIDPQGGTPRRLMRGVKILEGLLWSPDSQYLAFSTVYRFAHPLGPTGCLGVYRLRDGASCWVKEYGFKGAESFEGYGWVRGYQILLRRFATY